MRSIVLAGALLALTSASAGAESLNFTIFKEADPIGHDTYTIDKVGDLTKVRVEMQTDVKVLFIEYHYHQDRTETWKDGQIQSLVSDTNDDGTKHHVDLKRDGAALVASADGAPKTVPANVVPFTLWTNQFLKALTIFDVSNFGLLKVSVEDKGGETVSLAGKSIDAHKFHLTGDINWDLWYGPDGGLLKTAFKRRGYPISFVRQ